MKALIFDLDDTLVVEEASAEAAFLETCELAKIRYGVDPQDLHASVRETCRDLWHRAPARAYCLDVGISSWEGLWCRFQGAGENLRFLREWAPSYRRDSWLNALLKHDIDDLNLACELADTFGWHRRKLHVVYDDVEPALDSLKQVFSIGLLTNGAPDLQREKIEGSGIGKHFSEIVISGDVGFGKPDPRIFRITLDRLGAKPEEAVMIGNSLRSDIGGARSVGMKTVWVNRDGSTRDKTVVPDMEVESLESLTPFPWGLP